MNASRRAAAEQARAQTANKTTECGKCDWEQDEDNTTCECCGSTRGLTTAKWSRDRIAASA